MLFQKKKSSVADANLAIILHFRIVETEPFLERELIIGLSMTNDISTPQIS